MKMSDTERVKRYQAKCDAIMLRPPKAKGETIRQAAAAAGESLQGYILQAVERRMEQEKGDKGKPQDYAQAQGESVNGFIKRAIQETMERDDRGGDQA